MDEGEYPRLNRGPGLLNPLFVLLLALTRPANHLCLRDLEDLCSDKMVNEVKPLDSLICDI